MSPSLFKLMLAHAIPLDKVTKMSFSFEIAAIVSRILNSLATSFWRFSLFIKATNLDVETGIK